MIVVILIFAHLNMNSIWEKFKLISEQIKGNNEVLIDDSFLIGQFLIEEFCTPDGIGHDSKGGDILLYVRENIPSNLITVAVNPTGLSKRRRKKHHLWHIKKPLRYIDV